MNAGIGGNASLLCMRFIAISWPIGNPRGGFASRHLVLYVSQAQRADLLCSAAHQERVRSKILRDIEAAVRLVCPDN
jgi:hypothetical protein